MIQFFFIFLAALIAHDLLKLSAKKIGSFLKEVRGAFYKMLRSYKRKRIAKKKARGATL